MKNMSDIRMLVTAEKFRKSLLAALALRDDHGAAADRVEKLCAGMTGGVLYIKRSHGCFYFYERKDGRNAYLRKSSDRIYKLARLGYLKKLGLVLRERADWGNGPAFNKAFGELMNFLVLLEDAKLELARVVFSERQYDFYFGEHAAKTAPNGFELVTDCGVVTRSKSENDIGNRSELYALPYLYELRMTINVEKIVQKLADELAGGNVKKLCHRAGWTCYWNVPYELEYMNLPGSVWRSYNPWDGTITLHPDFWFVLWDGTIIVWEHEGMADLFRYRSNAGERVMLMLLSGEVPQENLVLSFESDVTNSAKLDKMIKERVVARMWF